MSLEILTEMPSLTLALAIHVRGAYVTEADQLPSVALAYTGKLDFSVDAKLSSAFWTEGSAAMRSTTLGPVPGGGYVGPGVGVGVG